MTGFANNSVLHPLESVSTTKTRTMYFCGLLFFLQLVGFSLPQVIPDMGKSISDTPNVKKTDMYQNLQDSFDQVKEYTEVEGSLYFQNDDKSALPSSILINLQIFPPGSKGTTQIASNIMAEPNCEGNVVILSSADKETTLDFQAGICVSMNKDMHKPKVHIGEFTVSGVSNMEFGELLEAISSIDLEGSETDLLLICFRESSTKEENCLNLEEIGRFILPFTILSKRDYNDEVDELADLDSADQEKGWVRITEILNDLVGDTLNQKFSEKLSSLSGHDLKRVYDWRKDVNEDFDDSLQYSFQRIDRDNLVKREEAVSFQTDGTERRNSVMSEEAKDAPDYDQDLSKLLNEDLIDCSPVTWFNIFRHSVFGTQLCQ